MIEKINRFDAVRQLTVAIRDLAVTVDKITESGMTLEQAFEVMSILDTEEPDIREVITNVITKLSGNVPDTDPNPTPEPEPEPELETPDEPESNEETLDKTLVESEDSETASAVEESTEPETPEAVEDASEAFEIATVSGNSRTINIDGVLVDVYNDGTLIVDGEKLIPYAKQGYYYVTIPAAHGEKRRILCHQLVADAWLPKKPKATDKIIHKNGCQSDCRASNLIWRSMYTRTIDRYDAGDVINASIALIAGEFETEKAVQWLANHKYRASAPLVRQVREKKLLPEVSDRYFDAKLRVRRFPEILRGEVDPASLNWDPDQCPATLTDVPEPAQSPEPDVEELGSSEINANEEDNTALIKDALAESGNKIRDAYKLLVKQGHPEISMYDIFNVKNGGAGDPPDDDVVELIRYAKKGGASDIRYTLLSKCNLLNVSQRQFNKATRGK